MNSIILLDDSGIIKDPNILQHMQTTLKLSAGDELKCTILNQGITKAKVLEISDTISRLQFIAPIGPGLAPWFELTVGVSRPQTSKKILEHATTFGAKKIHFFKAALSEKSYLTSNVFKDKAYEEYLLAGLSQSAVYYQMPEFKLDIYNPAAQYENASQKFILDIKTDKTFLDFNIDFSKPITLAVGPERGFIPEDIERFHSVGFQSVRISKTILRVEHAVYCAVSQLELLRGIK